MILTLTRCQILIAQHKTDSLYIETVFDKNLIRLHADGMGNLLMIYPKKIIRVSENTSYQDTFSSDLIDENIQMDTRYPLRTLLFNPRQNKIILLNTRWGILSTLDLFSLRIYTPSVASYGSDGTIWILDLGESTLYKLNENGTKKSSVASPFFYDKGIGNPQLLFDSKDYLVGLDSATGIYICDHFGARLRQFKSTSIQYYINRNTIYACSDTSIFLASIKPRNKAIGLTTKSKRINRKPKSIALYKGQLWLHFEDGTIEKYKDFEKQLLQ